MNQLDMFSVSGKSSLPPSSKDTGRMASSGATSPTLLPTPGAQDWKKRGPASRQKGVGEVVSLLPTPNASDHHSGKRKKPRDTLNSAIEIGATKHKTGLLSQAVSPASPSAMPDEEKERQMTATSGLTCLRLYEIQNPNGSSLKTCVASLLGAKAWYSNKSALTWKGKATKSNRLLFQLSPSTRRTEGIGSGLLPTTTSVDHKSRGPNSKQNGIDKMVKLLPTPDHNDGKRGAAKVYDPKAKSQSGRTINTLIGSGTGRKLRLSVAFTTWMMGFPENWAELPSPTQNGEKKD